ncbi:hypothetical protein ACJX0J_010372, partial [Zea mays]
THIFIYLNPGYEKHPILSLVDFVNKGVTFLLLASSFFKSCYPLDYMGLKYNGVFSLILIFMCHFFFHLGTEHNTLKYSLIREVEFENLNNIFFMTRFDVLFEREKRFDVMQLFHFQVTIERTHDLGCHGRSGTSSERAALLHPSLKHNRILAKLASFIFTRLTVELESVAYHQGHKYHMLASIKMGSFFFLAEKKDNNCGSSSGSKKMLDVTPFILKYNSF